MAPSKKDKVGLDRIPMNSQTAADATKKAKKTVDPNKPKKPLSSYFRYANAKRDEVKSANPGGWQITVSNVCRPQGYRDC